MPISAILWGSSLENQLDIGFSLFDIISDREERDGSEHVQSPAGAEDSWIVGRDFILDAEVRFIPDGPGTSPIQTQLSGANSWQAFLDYARDANPLRFVPDVTAPGFYIDNVYLVEPRKGFGGPGADLRRKFRIKLRNATQDFHQALRGIMLQVQPGMSLLDPTVVTFTRADATTCATRIKRDGTLETVAPNVLRIEWVDLDMDGIRETPGILLEGSRVNSCLQSQTLATTWTMNLLTAANGAGTGPDGTTSASSVIPTAVSSNLHYAIQAITITANENLGISIDVKPSGYTGLLFRVTDVAATNYFGVSVDLTGNGTILQSHVLGGGSVFVSKITLLANGYYRIQIGGKVGGGVTAANLQVWVFDTGAHAQAQSVYTGDGVSGLLATNAQLERGAAFPSSAIKTVASAVTRAADSLTLPFNFGPMDTTVLARMARPVWADVAGDLGFTLGIWQLANAVIPDIRGGGVQALRQWFGYIDTATADSNFTAAILAGAAQTIAWQFKNLATAGQVAADVGGGLGAFASAATAFSAYGNQVLRVGGLGTGTELYGVLLELKIASGLRTLAQMLSL